MATTTRKTAAQKAAEAKADQQAAPPAGDAAAVITGTPPANDTTLDSDTTKPSVTAPGDGPADTTDPSERAVSVPAAPGPEALATGTVNAVQPAPTAPAAKAAKEAKPRIEKFEATRPDGTVVKVTRNIETGESTIAD